MTNNSALGHLGSTVKSPTDICVVRNAWRDVPSCMTCAQTSSYCFAIASAKFCTDYILCNRDVFEVQCDQSLGLSQTALLNSQVKTLQMILLYVYVSRTVQLAT